MITFLGPGSHTFHTNERVLVFFSFQKIIKHFYWLQPAIKLKECINYTFSKYRSFDKIIEKVMTYRAPVRGWRGLEEGSWMVEPLTF